eukprot:CAMPEP_0204380400 /NCGR_PEP_ID=MMETSP0469-20131031/53339_1 /ASSEMBLY_ACC=CAM_ASM_000384 /TAXON_ID=2969 /ORGANISM="Oxyrrhis marina" /LENGTH=319 /DNA_ID=CAMNT_0051372023 /DNA_START=40 /DNA_END=999 /DNA_ORIENTATION=-
MRVLLLPSVLLAASAQYLVVAFPECSASGELAHNKFRYAVCPPATTTVDVRCTFDTTTSVYTSQLGPGEIGEAFLELPLWHPGHNTTVTCQVTTAGDATGAGVFTMLAESACPSQDLCTGGDTTTTSTTTARTTTIVTTTTAAPASGKLVVHQKCDDGGVRSSASYTVQVCPPASQNVTDVTCSAADSFTIGAGLVVEREGNLVSGSTVTCRTVNPNIEDGTIEWSVIGICEQGCPAPGAAAVGGEVQNQGSDDTGLDTGIIFAIVGGALGLAALVACCLLRYSAAKAADLDRSKGAVSGKDDSAVEMEQGAGGRVAGS